MTFGWVRDSPMISAKASGLTAVAIVLAAGSGPPADREVPSLGEVSEEAVVELEGKPSRSLDPESE